MPKKIISASGVSLKWVKSNERRRERERRAKVSVNNGQYICLNQNVKIHENMKTQNSDNNI